MYNDDRSDFAAPIVGFLYVGFVAIMVGVYAITGCIESLRLNLDSAVFYYAGIAGFVIAGFNLYKAYIPEGVTFGLVAFVAFASQNLFVWTQVDINEYAFHAVSAFLAAAIALLVLFVLAGILSFLRGYLDLAIINGAMGAAAFFIIGWSGPKAVFIVGGIVALVAAGVALYVAFVDWMFAQDVLEDIEDDFCCDDDECDCGCEHGEDCECDECKAAAEESAEADAAVETEESAQE